MRTRLFFAVATVALLTGFASRSFAQLPQDWNRWNAKAGWNGSVTESSHQDEGVGSLVMGFHAFGKGFLSAGGELRFGHEQDYGAVQKYLGAIQYNDPKSLKWPCFINLYAGLEHLSDINAFYMEPAAGVVFPWGFKDYKLYGQIGMPIHFFEGNTEVGFSGQVGLTLPFIK